MRGAKVEVNCKSCGTQFTARVADRKRGWGKYCSKSCKAKKCINGMRANRAFHRARNYSSNGESELFANAHLFSNED